MLEKRPINFCKALFFLINPLTPDKLRINATFRQQMAFFGHFRPNSHEKCFLVWTVAVSFGLRTFPSILSSGMRTIPNFEKLHRLRLFEI